MATKPAAKAVAPKASAKPAASKAPATASKTKAAAPAAEEAAADEELIFDVGSVIKFLGYDESVPEAEQLLEVDAEYVIDGFTDPDDQYPEGLPIVSVDNPDFNAKKKEHPETNPKFIQVEVLPEEMELVASPDDGAAADADADAQAAADAQAQAEAEAAEAKAAKGTKGKAATKEAAPAKGKAAAKEAPAAKGKGKAAPKAAAPAADDSDVPQLDHEDPEVQELIDSGEDLIAVGQELEQKSGLAEYQLGGILSYIQRNKLHLGVEGGDAYAEKGGFATFIKDYYNVDYRKAMYLIAIYNKFSQIELPEGESIADKIALIGWTKAAKLERHLAEDGSNAVELLELAENSTVSDLSSALQEQTKVGGTRTDGESVTRTTLRFRLYEEEGSMVLRTLEEIQKQRGLADINEALYAMTQDWHQANGGEAAAEKAPAQKASQGQGKPAARRSAVKA